MNINDLSVGYPRLSSFLETMANKKGNKIKTEALHYKGVLSKKNKKGMCLAFFYSELPKLSNDFCIIAFHTELALAIKSIWTSQQQKKLHHAHFLH